MSDEEKKEYEEAKLYLTHTGLDDFNLEKYQSENRIWAIQIILNLIEKQSKEIEELKAISEYREKIIKGLGLKTLPKTITGFKKLIENNDKKWGDKIKAKIEELDYNDIGNFERRCKQEVLQSLLEKE